MSHKMSREIEVRKVYTFVLKSGTTHNVVTEEIQDDFVVGRIALDRMVYMYDRRNQPKCEFGFCLSNEINTILDRKDINVIESSRIFISPPRKVVIPFDNVGLLEEAPYSFLESEDALGDKVVYDDEKILEKVPAFKFYKAHDGFYQNPVLIKGSQGSPTVIHPINMEEK